MNSKNYVNYKGNFLKRDSKAFELWELAVKSNDYKKLDLHIKELEQKEIELQKRY